MNHEFTPADVVREVRKLAAAEPDFIYTKQPESPEEIITCSYLGAVLDAPGVGRPCIVGQALQNLGVTEAELRNWESQGAEDVVCALTHTARSDETCWLRRAQGRQDAGDPWGDAVAWAEKEVSLG